MLLMHIRARRFASCRRTGAPVSRAALPLWWRSSQSSTSAASLSGAVHRSRTLESFLFDPATSRASVVELEVAMAVKLTEKATGKTLWENNYLTFKQRYEISTTQTAYFDESSPALERLSREAARNIVSAILSNF